MYSALDNHILSTPCQEIESTVYITEEEFAAEENARKQIKVGDQFYERYPEGLDLEY